MKQYIIFSLIFLSVNFIVYKISYKEGMKVGYRSGYTKGTIDLALDITNETGIKINTKTPKERYYHFKEIKDITLYIYEKNGIKTIGIWE